MPPNARVGKKKAAPRITLFLGSVLLAGAIAWLAMNIDWRELFDVLVKSDWRYFGLISATVIGEQALRALKWRQILFDIKPISSARILAAILAGYAAGIIIPFGVSPFVRAYIVAQSERLRTMTVLTTVGVDRGIDAAVFLIVAASALALYSLPAASEQLGNQIQWVLVLNAVALCALGWLLINIRTGIMNERRWLSLLINFVPQRFQEYALRFSRHLADGILLPHQWQRRLIILVTSVAMRAMTVLLFVFAGRAVGVEFSFPQGLFLIVIPGMFYALSRLLRIPGGFVVGGVLALTAIGQSEVQALAIMSLIHFISAATIALVGLPILFAKGIELGAAMRH